MNSNAEQQLNNATTTIRDVATRLNEEISCAIAIEIAWGSAQFSDYDKLNALIRSRRTLIDITASLEELLSQLPSD